MAKVSFDFVKKIIVREKRNIFYLKDGAQKVLDFNEDETKSVSEVVEQIEDAIANISGGAVTLELPAKAKGKGTNGGDTTLTKLVYTLALNGAASEVQSMPNLNGNNFMFSLLMEQMKTNQNLQSELLLQKNQAQIDELKRELRDSKGRSKGDLIELFADKVGDKLLEANRLEKVAKKAASATTIKSETVAHSAPINSNENTPIHEGKEKIKAALRNFKAIDPDYADNVKFLSDYANKNPEAYKLFIDGLKNTSNE